MTELSIEEKAAAVDRMEIARKANNDRAIAAARESAAVQARADVRAWAAPRLVDPVIRAALANHLGDDALAVLLDSMDRTKMLDADGDVDQAKIAAFVAGLAPDADAAARRRFPSLGQGRRGDPGAGRSTVETGRALYAGRHRSGGGRR